MLKKLRSLSLFVLLCTVIAIVSTFEVGAVGGIGVAGTNSSADESLMTVDFSDVDTLKVVYINLYTEIPLSKIDRYKVRMINDTTGAKSVWENIDPKLVSVKSSGCPYFCHGTKHTITIDANTYFQYYDGFDFTVKLKINSSTTLSESFSGTGQGNTQCNPVCLPGPAILP